MSSKKHLMLALLAGFLVLAIGTGLLVWPALSETNATTERIADLDHKNRTLDERTEQIQQLKEQVADAEASAKHELKRIPDAPEVADLMRQLSMPVDGYLVADQTFTTNVSKEASSDASVTARAVPVTVDMEARFEAIQEVLRRAESSDRLVRVASVRISRHPDRSNLETDDDAMLKASIMLEAIYEPRMVGGVSP